MKKKHPEHVNLERWLVSYADFITLLFAFFVIMYAISQADMAKFKVVSSSIKAAFASAAGPAGMIDIGGKSGGNTANQFELEEIPGGRMMNMPAGKTNTAAEEDPELREIKELLEESISLELGVADVSDKMQLLFDSRGLVVRLATKDFFDSGEVEIKPDLQPVLERIGRIVSKSKKLIRIEGHSDPSEASTHGYPSDWELSAARAAWVAKYWLGRFQMDTKKIGIAGYAHYRPVSENKTELGRAKNRRVEIVILNNQYTM